MEIYKCYVERKLEKYKRKEEFDKIKSDFFSYIISVPEKYVNFLIDNEKIIQVLDRNNMNDIDIQRIEDFIKTLGGDELIYITRLVVERLKLLSQMKSTTQMARFNIGEE